MAGEELFYLRRKLPEFTVSTTRDSGRVIQMKPRPTHPLSHVVPTVTSAFTYICYNHNPGRSRSRWHAPAGRGIPDKRRSCST